MKSIEDVLALIRPLDEVWLERGEGAAGLPCKAKGQSGKA